MLTLAYFGVNSSGLTLAVDLLILFAGILYLSLIYWTYADARRRIADTALVWCSAAASLFPFVGTIVYLVLRPPEYLEDVRERELEMQAAEARIYQLDFELCPYCDYRIERDFVRCPSCLRKLKDRCVSCSKPLDRAWTICPYCETEVPSSGSSARGRRRTGATEAQTPAAREKSAGTKTYDSTRAGSPASGRSSGPPPRDLPVTDEDEDPDRGIPLEQPGRSRSEDDTEPSPQRPRNPSRSRPFS
ncbi:MAG TPA: zinc ribbon domain-containing protein [Solirubrobacteraceae bacterium]|jgi:heme exporter protein D